MIEKPDTTDRDARRAIRAGLSRLRITTGAALGLAFLVELFARYLDSRQVSTPLLADLLSMVALLTLCGTALYLVFHLPNRPALKLLMLGASVFMIFSEILNMTEERPTFLAGWPLLTNQSPWHDEVQSLLLVGGLILTLLVIFWALIDAVASERRLAQEKRDLAAEVEVRKQAEVALEQSREALRGLSRHIEEVREEERKRIAREIHDELGQTLTLFKMDLSTLEYELRKRDTPELVEMLEGMQKALMDTMQSVRRIIGELRPGLLDDLGLVAAAEWQCREFQRRTGIHCNYEVAPWDGRLPEERATALFRILQEALTNVAKHARATEVQTSLHEEQGVVKLSVHDNGRGVAVEDLGKKESYGVRGIQERALQFGGKVSVEASPEGGTTVIVLMPFS